MHSDRTLLDKGIAYYTTTVKVKWSRYGTLVICKKWPSNKWISPCSWYFILFSCLKFVHGSWTCKAHASKKAMVHLRLYILVISRVLEPKQYIEVNFQKPAADDSVANKFIANMSHWAYQSPLGLIVFPAPGFP